MPNVSKITRKIMNSMWAILGLLLMAGAILSPREPNVGLVTDVISRLVVIAVAVVCMHGFITERK